MACILLVEDDFGFQIGCKRHIEPMGHEVVTVETAEEALDFLAERTPDLAIVDLFLPGMDGAELIRCLRASPQTADMPVVAFTCMMERIGLGFEEEDKSWLPADLVLDKSQGAATVVDVIRGLLDGRA